MMFYSCMDAASYSCSTSICRHCWPFWALLLGMATLSSDIWEEGTYNGLRCGQNIGSCELCYTSLGLVSFMSALVRFMSMKIVTSSSIVRKRGGGLCSLSYQVRDIWV
jgi:hypothetical protein